MSLPLLFADELRGFYRSKVMLFLWVGLPVMSVVFYLWNPDTGGELPLTALVSLLVVSLSGTLAAVMIVVGIIHERDRHVYDLFVIRPIRRWEILVAKFLAVYLCVVVAAVVALGVGLAVDYALNDTPMDLVLEGVADSLAISLSALLISTAAGVLIGIVSPSILVGAILVIYLGNQIAGGVGAAAALMFDNGLYPVAMGAAIAGLLLWLASYVFERRQL